MRTRTRTRTVGALALVLLASGAGCATPYKPPTAAQPHAVVKLRRTYQTSGGTHLREQVSIDGHEAFVASDAAESAKAARTDAILVHPTTAEVRVAAGFFHTEMRVVQETYYVQVPYTTTESYGCGSGRSYQTCTRTVTHYRSEPRQRTVVRPVEVSDGSCAATAWLSPAVNGTYVLEYDFTQHALCRLACFDQAPGAESSTFEIRPCEPPSAEQIRKAVSTR